jgi:hypothetical protein
VWVGRGGGNGGSGGCGWAGVMGRLGGGVEDWLALKELDVASTLQARAATGTSCKHE